MSVDKLTNFDRAKTSFNGVVGGSSPWLSEYREKSYEDFKLLGFPTRKQEDWKYANFRDFKNTDFDYLSPGSATKAGSGLALLEGAATIVFDNGSFSQHQSNLAPIDGLVEICSLADYLADHEQSGKDLLSSSDAMTGNPMVSLNSAFLAQGVYVKVLADTKNAEINFVYNTSSGKQASSAFIRNIVDLGENSAVSICEHFTGQGDHYFSNTVTSYRLASDACLDHFRIESESSGGFQFSEQKFHLSERATLNSFVFNMGASWSRNNLSVNLIGPFAEANLNGVYLPCESQFVDHHTNIVHEVPDTKSSQLYKGILKDKSRAVFAGRIEVKPGAARTSAFQLNKNLMLSNDAEVDTTPQLQIDHSDVKCSHGATVGQLSAEEIFYLQSRGLRSNAAKQLLCKGYISDVFKPIQHVSILDYLNSSLVDFLGKGSAGA